MCNAFIAINNGGLTGVGLGKSTQKYSYIPEPHTDMVFAIIAEENGVIVSTYCFLHIFTNFGGLFCIIPLTGVPLPFLSYGGSFTLSLVATFAIIQRIHIEMKNEKIRV